MCSDATANYDLQALNLLANARTRIAPSAGLRLDADENLLGAGFAGGSGSRTTTHAFKFVSRRSKKSRGRF
jgi:hypothetical protein